MGFVQIVADGDLHELLSNEMQTVPNQPVAFSIWVRWTGITYTGSNPISMGVTEYLNGEEVNSPDLAWIASPASSSSYPSEDDFFQLVADYTVPALGVDEIRMRLKVAPTVTAGTVDWGDAEMLPGMHVRDEVVPGIGITVDNITNKLYGLDLTGWLQSDSAAALGDQNSTVKGHSVAIAALQAQLTPGVATSDSFERSASTTSLGSDWDENYGAGNGNWALDGHDAYWYSPSPYGSRESLCRWIGTHPVSTTDYQVIGCVLASNPGKPGDEVAYNDVIGRCDSSKQNYIRFRVGGDGTWSLSKFISGTETVMVSGTASPPGSGSSLALACGDKGTSTPRYFTCSISGSVVAQGVYSDTTSQFGATYRGWGFGGEAIGDLFSSPTVPGLVALWSAYDTS